MRKALCSTSDPAVINQTLRGGGGSGGEVGVVISIEERDTRQRGKEEKRWRDRLRGKKWRTRWQLPLLKKRNVGKNML